jgi:G:T-mismatch repair DNA endonuclease (very short patch repair protein)
MELTEVPIRGGNVDLVSVDHRKTIASGCFYLRHQIKSMITNPDCSWEFPVTKVGKKAAGRLLDGREWTEFPASTTEQGQ